MADPTPVELPMMAILRHTKAWRLMAIILVYITALVLMVPILPTLMTDDFASRREGKPIRCEEYRPPLEMPPACQDAHSDVVIWSTWSGFVQNTILSVMLVRYYSLRCYSYTRG